MSIAHSDSSPSPGSPPPPVQRREILGWCLYDVADSAFTTVIITTFYSSYFRYVVVGDPGRVDQLWGRANALSAVAIACLAPVLGAIADYANCRKRFLTAFALVLFTFTALLSLTGPGTVGLAMVLFVLANIGFAGGGVFIDSFLPGLSNESNAGRISGLKWALGYAGGLVAVVLCLGLAKNIQPDPTSEQVALARWIPVVVAVWYGVMVIPTLVLLRERGQAKPLPVGQNYLTVGLKQLSQTFRNLRRYRDLVILFVAFIAYNEGISTVIQFAAAYAQGTVGFTTPEVGTMFIVLNVVALVGALSFGWLADRIGQKRAIFLSLGIWLACTLTAYFSSTKAVFWVAAVFAGIGMGSCQSVTRSLVALFSPPENAAEFYGFLGIAGKALAFLGPLAFGEISAATGSQRPAILAIGGFFVVGAVVLSFVDEKRGKAAARMPVGAE